MSEVWPFHQYQCLSHTTATTATTTTVLLLLLQLLLLCVCVCVCSADNILIQRVAGGQSTNTSASAVSAVAAVSVYDGSMDEGLGDESIDELDHIVYKIGDLGQVTGVSCQSVDEGIYF